jgi:TfoX/Sxy family transcriptional regulator of competence genes
MKNETLADRLRDFMISRNIPHEEKKMFGGLVMMVNGNMLLGVTHKGEFMVRIDPTETEKALKRKGARLMDFTGRPMKGILSIDSDGYENDDDFESWVNLSLQFVSTLPIKVKKPKTKKPA